MPNLFLVSVVITTYNRSEHLIKILECLKRNHLNFQKFEIIICDSYSNDSTEFKVNSYKSSCNYLNISFLNVKKNINSVKRNLGFAQAQGKYVIFLDDDCYPVDDFIKNYYYILSTRSTKNKIFCGSVRYPQHLMKKNFVRYRQSRHFFFEKKIHVENDELEPEKIVTMNMATAKSNFIFNQKLFNEKFSIYGFEDFEFGCRIQERKFKIIACSPLVYHYDDRPFALYLNKIKFLGSEGMKYLIKINPQSAKKNNFFKLENNTIIRNLLKYKFINFLLNNAELFCIKLEKLKIFPSLLYKVAFASSYLLGCIERKTALYEDSDKKKWYK